jgi:hypothetical protein
MCATCGEGFEMLQDQQRILALEVTAMRKVEEIEEQIRTLSGAELAEFRKWYAEFDAQAWDKQIEADVKTGKLDALGEAARRARREGKSTEL